MLQAMGSQSQTRFSPQWVQSSRHTDVQPFYQIAPLLSRTSGLKTQVSKSSHLRGLFRTSRSPQARNRWSPRIPDRGQQDTGMEAGPSTHGLSLRPGRPSRPSRGQVPGRDRAAIPPRTTSELPPCFLELNLISGLTSLTLELEFQTKRGHETIQFTTSNFHTGTALFSENL